MRPRSWWGYQNALATYCVEILLVMYHLRVAADRDDIDPFARMMLSAYVDTAADARLFAAEHGFPTTTLDKAHRFRSTVQAAVHRSDRYSLNPEYVESGRVQVTDDNSHWSCLIRSKSAMTIDAAVSPAMQLELFRVSAGDAVSLPSLLSYKFIPTGMSLWVCETKTVFGRKRLAPSGDLEYLGFWAFDEATPPDGEDGASTRFDQGTDDPFEDLGNPDLGETGQL